MSASSQEILRSFRNLYRHGLHAVRYSSPARHTLRDCLQQAFRSGVATDLNLRKIENTIRFLDSAGRDTGLAHHILKNLLHVRWWQAQTRLHRKQLVFSYCPVVDLSLKVFGSQKAFSKKNVTAYGQIRRNAFYHYNITLRIFNESMDLCLPEPDVTGIEVQDSQPFDGL